MTKSIVVIFGAGAFKKNHSSRVQALPYSSSMKRRSSGVLNAPTKKMH